ncbi:MAG TPA: AAA family ATPase, partial [Vicinamibacterales bacterium]|nr:AAA family ATPase [Vicinamibacterales bacterium]
MRFIGRLREGLARTTAQLRERLGETLRRAEEPARRGRLLEPETLEALEEALIAADVGVAAAAEITAAVRVRAGGGASLRTLVREEILRMLAAADRPPAPGGAPRVVLVVGVNGTGKTTTVGKLAKQAKDQGLEPLVCAADTFRAAAVEQLAVWAARAGVDVVRARPGADPAAVVFDAIAAAKARGRGLVLVDTAG